MKRGAYGMASGHVSRRLRRQVVEFDSRDTLVDTVDDPLGDLRVVQAWVEVSIGAGVSKGRDEGC